jgi:hypothetical protein
MFTLEYHSVTQVQSIQVTHLLESRFDEVRFLARFIKQNNSPYSNGMGREMHDIVSREIRIAGLSNRLENLCNFVGSEISHYALMVDEMGRLIIRLTEVLCLQVDSICCVCQTDVVKEKHTL